MLTIHFKAVGKKSFIYRVKGTTASLEQYRSDKGENLVEEDETNVPLYFIPKSSDFMPSGTVIAGREDEDTGEVRYWPVESEQSIIARQALEKVALRAFGATSTPVAKQQEEDDDQKEPNLETKKASKPTAKPRRKI